MLLNYQLVIKFCCCCCSRSDTVAMDENLAKLLFKTKINMFIYYAIMIKILVLLQHYS